jgi:hypothetical protein
MSRKENALDLSRFIDKGVRVKLSGGREGVTPVLLALGTSTTSFLRVNAIQMCQCPFCGMY